MSQRQRIGKAELCSDIKNSVLFTSSHAADVEFSMHTRVKNHAERIEIELGKLGKVGQTIFR